MGRVSSFLWTGVTWAVFKDSGKIPCLNDRLMIKLSDFDETLTLTLKIVTGILNRPKAFRIFDWDISLCTSPPVVGLSRNELNELFLRKFLNGLVESGMVFDRLGAISTKKLLKALAMSAGFVISFPFNLTMVG